MTRSMTAILPRHRDLDLRQPQTTPAPAVSPLLMAASTTEYAIATNYAVGWQAWNVGMVYKSVRPDGSMTERIWAKNNLVDYGSANAYRATILTSKQNSLSIKTAAAPMS